MIFQSIKTSDLSDGMINEILTLKDSHWNFGIKSQKKWFLKYVMSNDIHNIIKFKKKIVGYTSLSYRSFNSSSSKKLSNEKKYILFATFIIKRRFRNFFYASKMMKFNNKVILGKKKSSFLLCHKEKVNFYKFYGWTQLNSSTFKVPDHKHSLIGMVFNFTRSNKNNKKIHKFFYYR